MKKLSMLILLMLLLLVLSGCGREQEQIAAVPEDSSKLSVTEADARKSEADETVDMSNSLISVYSDGILTEPYENWIWSETYYGDGWLSADGISIYYEFPEVHEEIPRINYGDDFEIYYGNGVSFSFISVYSENFEELYHNEGEYVLENLKEGTYYIVISVKAQGKYIKSEDKYESSGYQCVYKLEVSDSGGEI